MVRPRSGWRGRSSPRWIVGCWPATERLDHLHIHLEYPPMLFGAGHRLQGARQVGCSAGPGQTRYSRVLTRRERRQTSEVPPILLRFRAPSGPSSTDTTQHVSLRVRHPVCSRRVRCGSRRTSTCRTDVPGSNRADRSQPACGKRLHEPLVMLWCQIYSASARIGGWKARPLSHGKTIQVSWDTSVMKVSTNGRPMGLA
jgi:hypothetical protein